MTDVDPAPDGVFVRLRALARFKPQAEALVVNGERYSYAALCALVERCAAGLQQAGCGEGSGVAVAVGNSLDFIVCALSTFAIGGILVPLNPRFKPEELRHYLSVSRPRAIVAPPELETLIRQLELPIPVQARTSGELSSDAAFVQPARLDQSAVYMFSSGSTGMSKRVTRTQAQWLAEYDALAATVALSGADRVLCTVPLYHAHGFGNALMAALVSGATLVLLTAEFNPRATMKALVDERITIYPSVPFMLKMLADTRFAAAPELGALRLVITAGAALPEAVQKSFLQAFGIPISQLYGSTETGAMTINLKHARHKPGSVGRPLAGYEMQVRDDSGAAAAAGSVGEIWFRSTSMTARYDELPGATAESFIDGWFFAGDLGYADADGDLYITGRKKLIINVAGYKVDPLEVENVLTQHPQVADVVVVGVQHAATGEKVKAVVVARDRQSCSEPELIEFAAARLAPYKVPRQVEFRDEVPRSPLGKVLRKYLLDGAAVPAKASSGD